MRRTAFAFLTGTLALIISAPALAVCATGSMPFQLQNGTVADATQVMANFNQITTGVGSSCAASGVNNDITALGALSTPISPAQGGTPVFAGGVTSGTGNAQTLAVNNNFTLATGYHVSGFFSVSNTGPMTLQVNSGAITPVWRKQQFGVSSTQGGEALAGHPFEMVYNGTQWIMLGETIMIGEMRNYVIGGSTPPAGWLIADGSSFTCSTFQDLCNQIGTTYGGTSSNPNLPDTRGRVVAGLDSYGTGAGAASRLTNAATGCGTLFTGMGVTCANASQSHTQIIAELAQHNHTDSGHTHPQAGNTILSAVGASGASNSSTNLTLGGTTGTGNAVITNTGSSQPMPIVNPNIGMVMIIRY